MTTHDDEDDTSPNLVAPSLLDCLGITDVGSLVYSYLEPQALMVLNEMTRPWRNGDGPALLEVATIDGIDGAILCFLRPSDLHRVALVNRTTRHLCRHENMFRVFSSQLPILLKDSDGNKTLCLARTSPGIGDSSSAKPDEDRPTCAELPLKPSLEKVGREYVQHVMSEAPQFEGIGLVNEWMTYLLNQEGLSFRGDHRFKLDSSMGIEQRQIEITTDGGYSIVLSFFKKTSGKPTSQDVSLFVVNFTAINGLLPSVNNA